jgi:hypothetical protein
MRQESLKANSLESTLNQSLLFILMIHKHFKVLSIGLFNVGTIIQMTLRDLNFTKSDLTY